MTKTRQAILDQLADGKEVKSGEIAKHLGKSLQTVSNCLHSLKFEGLVENPHYGQWTIKRGENISSGDAREVTQLHDVVDTAASFEPAPNSPTETDPPLHDRILGLHEAEDLLLKVIATLELPGEKQDISNCLNKAYELMNRYARSMGINDGQPTSGL